MVTLSEMEGNLFGIHTQCSSELTCLDPGLREIDHCTTKTAPLRHHRRPFALAWPKPGGDCQQEFKKNTTQTERSRTFQVELHI